MLHRSQIKRKTLDLAQTHAGSSLRTLGLRQKFRCSAGGAILVAICLTLSAIAVPEIITSEKFSAFVLDNNGNLIVSPYLFAITNGLWTMEVNGDLYWNSNTLFDCWWKIDTQGNATLK